MPLKWKSLLSRRLRLFLLFPALAVLFFGLSFFRLVDFHEEDTLDFRFRLRGVQAAHPAITIVVVDDDSLKAFGQWPWPRSIHAAFLGVLLRYKPQMVFFDMLFTEDGPKPEDDELFARAVKKSGNVILPFFYRSLDPFEVQFPTPLLLQSIKKTAFVNALEDHDGHIRRTQLFINTPKGIFYSPSAVMAAAFQKIPVSREKLPSGMHQNIWINFPGTLDSFRVVSYGEVISLTDSEKDAARLTDLFKDRLVMVGHMATGTTDLKATSFSTRTPGIVVHASTLHTLLVKKHLREMPDFWQLILLLFLACFCAFLFKKISPAVGFGAMVAIQLIYFGLNTVLFITQYWIFPLVVPLTLIAVVYIASLFSKYAEIYLQKQMSERELSMAASIQAQFLPQARPKSDLLEIAFETRFTKTVGGDLYDWVELGDDKLGFCVGDVSGKGMPAAIYMAKSMSDFRSISKKDRAAGEVCSEMNRILIDNPASGMFLTLLYAVVDPRKKKLFYASAGHEFALFFHKKSGKAEILKGAQGMPLGMFESEYETCEADFEPGDAMVLYSDGVKELRNAKGQEYGVDNLLKRFEEASLRGMNGEEIVRAMFMSMQKHQGSLAAHDDRTLLCVRFLQA